MSTMLVDELEQAAVFASAACQGGFGIHYAAQLRARAAWLRELGKLRPSPGLANMLRGFNDGFAYDLWSRFRDEFIAALTGPIPAAETAPTERKEP